MKSGERLADRLVSAAAEAFVGRAVEREQLASVLTHERGPAVVFLHGTGGIGKTMLINETLDRLDVVSARVDGRLIEPTPAGVLEAIGRRLGLDRVASSSIDTTVSAFTQVGVRVLALDSYDHLEFVDGWLRNDLLPALPAAVRAVLVGRNPPNVAWRTARGWRHLIAEQVLGPLTEHDAAALLARRHLPQEQAERALRFGRGHPLALELAAEAYARRPQLELEDGPAPEVVEELVDVLFEDLTSDAQRIVEAASLLRRVTEPSLAAVLDTDDVTDAWRMLRDLPMTAMTPAGLMLNLVVKDVTATALELRNPQRARNLRRRAALAAISDAKRTANWATTADLMHLVQDPVIRAAVAPSAGFQHPVERARPDDRDAILAIARRYDGTEGEEIVRRWWAAHADTFVVLRGPDGEVSAFSTVVAVDRLDRTLANHDPVTARLLDDVASRPLPPGRRAIVNRRALAARGGPEHTPDLAPMVIDVKRTYIEMRADLARVYIPRNGDALDPTLTKLDFTPVGEPVDVGDRPFLLSALDFGPGGVDGWLARHVVAETERADSAGLTPPKLCDDAPVLVARLSPRETEVLAALAEGLTNNELAERLFISERTANRHVSSIFTKLGVHNRTAAARVAIEAGLAG